MGEVVGFIGVSGKAYKATDADISETAYPLVRLNTGGEVAAEPEEWTVEDRDGNCIGKLYPSAFMFGLGDHRCISPKA